MFDRRDLLAAATALFGPSLLLPLDRAFAAPLPGFEPSRAAFTPDQRLLCAAIGDRIIPATDTPGATAAGVPQFMELMLADWYEASGRNDFMKGLGILDGYARIRYDKPFAAITPDQQDGLLTQAMQGQVPGLDAAFFEHCRQMVILGYFTSEIGCKQERIYLPVPGHYDGQYPYAAVKRVFTA